MEKKNGDMIPILAVYAPSGDNRANREFWEHIQTKVKRTRGVPRPQVMLGDMNLVETGVDRIPMRLDDKEAVNALQ
jgi:exonuclease III